MRQVEYTMPLKKNALGPSEAYNIEQYTVAAKEPGGWIVNIEVNTPKASICLKFLIRTVFLRRQQTRLRFCTVQYNCTCS